MGCAIHKSNLYAPLVAIGFPMACDEGSQLGIVVIPRERDDSGIR